MTRVVLRDTELALLTEDERLALEYVLRTTLSEVARVRRAGDSALLLAVSAAEVLGALLERHSQDEVDDLVAAMPEHEVGRVALRRARDVARLTDAA